MPKTYQLASLIAVALLAAGLLVEAPLTRNLLLVGATLSQGVALALQRPTTLRSWLLAGGLFACLTVTYMRDYGIANIVSAGQRASARIAVSTLRTILWAQDHCQRSLGRACRLQELNGEERPEGLPGVPLRLEFRGVIEATEAQETVQIGSYRYRVYHPPAGAEGIERRRWIAYAWPIRERGRPLYCINEREVILEGENQPPYDEAGPAKGACRNAEGTPQLDGPGQDGRPWRRWRGKSSRRLRALEAEETVVPATSP